MKLKAKWYQTEEGQENFTEGGVPMESDNSGKKSGKRVKKSYEYESGGFAQGNIIEGVIIIAVAIALLLGKLGYLGNLLEGISVWTVLWTILFVSTLIEGITKFRIGEILFSLAFLVIVHDEMLGLEAITPWPVLGAALLLTVGIKKIFPRKKKHNGIITFNGKKVDAPVFEESRNGNAICYQNAFGSAVKYVAGEFNRMDVENAFGSMQLYFTDATLIEGEAKVNVESAFGSIVLYVPSSWKVITKGEKVLSSVTENGEYNEYAENILYIDMEVFLGKLDIKYI